MVKPIKEGKWWYAPVKKGSLRTIRFGTGLKGFFRAKRYSKRIK